MRAVVVTEFGPPEVLQLRDLPRPEPGPGQVRVRVSATSVNFADIQSRRAPYRPGLVPPFVPGLEAAGTIDAVGPGVRGWEVGQRVAVHADGGSYAEYALARAIEVFALPENVAFEQAAVVPSVGTTAMALLTMAGRLQPGESVLIHAAAGGVGSTALQFARLLGAGLIIGTVGSAIKAKVALELGADVVINYRDEDVVERVRAATGGAGVDVVLDGVGAATTAMSMAALAPFGRLVLAGQSSGPPAPIAFGPVYGENKSVIGYSTGGYRRTRPEALRAPGLAALTLLARGRWRPLIGARYPLAEAAAAHRLVEERESVGKVLLLP